MRIGEVARVCGVTPKAIRYYESIGLLPPPERTASGYRDYDAEDVARIAFIRDAQEVGLSLERIGSVLSLRDGGRSPCDYVREVVREVAGELDQRIADLERTRRQLDTILASEDGDEDGARFCRLIERRPPVGA